MTTETVTEPQVVANAEIDTIADWYRTAVIYQIHVRSFADSNGDGIGDFVGLTQKLDYIESLGVTAIWLQPFYPSPQKDDGYDIADFLSIHPHYGTFDDFQRFLDEAHRRDLRVITELVINHTSDQHPWFQRARRAAPGSPDRSFYVWGDDPRQYANTRVIFHEVEPSNWSWDPVAQSYFWHRFYSHQPDLNFDHEPVHDAVLEIVDFWMRRGVDGMRLDAIPYLYEREGTTCESLPETHAFLKKLRSYVDQHFPGRMLLAEANQWTEDAAEYFGDGDECHMSFHFPLMTRMFMSVQQESRFPVADILQQTPAIPRGCQWAVFLRSHDELTLEMVSEEERDYMYRQFADDPQARVHWGIRRRLAPLVKNSRRKLELLYGLLFALPGTPIVYYGDEIRMGDNIYLRDRDAVRTPMQWSSDRNAGFSTANPQRLFLPVITDPAFHYTTRNVENDHASPNSFLWWMRRFIQLRNRYPAFGRGDLRLITSNNSRVLAFVREHESETILVVANFSRYAQGVDLELQPWAGRQPVELFGRTRFPAITEHRYFLSLGPQSFYWLRLPSIDVSDDSPGEQPIPRFRTMETWPIRPGNAVWDDVREALPAFFFRQPWFQGSSRPIRNIDWRDVIPLEDQSAAHGPWLLVCHIDFLEGESQEYLLLLQWSDSSFVGERRDRSPSLIAEVTWPDGKTRAVSDVGGDACVWACLFERFRSKSSIRTPAGELTTVGAEALKTAPPIAPASIVLRSQSDSDYHTSATWSGSLNLKLYRRVEPGMHPEVEVGQALTSLAQPTALVPRLSGWLEYRRAQQPVRILATLRQYVPHELSAWEWLIDDLRRIGEVWSCGLEDRSQCGTLVLPDDAKRIDGVATRSLHALERIGQGVARLHADLSSGNLGPAFAPEPFTPHYRRSLYQSMRIQLLEVFESLGIVKVRVPAETSEIIARILDRREEFLTHFETLLELDVKLHRIRCHGDLRLPHILLTGDQLAFVDFAGNPYRPLSERRIRRCALRDLASLLTSVVEVSFAVGQTLGLPSAASARLTANQRELHSLLEEWEHSGQDRLLTAYQDSAAPLYCPKSKSETERLLAIYRLDHLLSLVNTRLLDERTPLLPVLYQLLRFPSRD